MVTIILFAPSVGPDHMIQKCALHLQKTEKENNICIYCGSKSHPSGRYTSKPNDNREEPRSTPRDLQDCRTGNTSSNNHVFNQNRDSHHQTRFDKRFNRQHFSTSPDFSTRLHSRSRFEHHIDIIDQHTIKITRKEVNKRPLTS